MVDSNDNIAVVNPEDYIVAVDDALTSQVSDSAMVGTYTVRFYMGL